MMVVPISNTQPDHPYNTQSKFSTRTWYGSGLEMLLLGGVCAVVAFEGGRIVAELVGVGEGGGVAV